MSISGIPSSTLSPYQFDASLSPLPVSSPIVSPPIVFSPSPAGPSPMDPVLNDPALIGPALNQISQNLTPNNLSSAQQAYAALEHELSALGAATSGSNTQPLQSPVSLEA
jgi:hypothetical protein